MTKPAPAPIPPDQLVADHLRLVKLVALDVHDKLPAHVDLEDLIAAGICGLIGASRRYDPANGATFATFARFRIRGAILDTLRESDWASRQSRRDSKRIEIIIESLGNRLLRTPTQEETVNELGLGTEAYHQLVSELRECEGAISLTGRPKKHLKDGERVALDPQGPRESWPDCRRQKAELKESLDRGCRGLPERWRAVVHMYYQDELPMEQIGKRLGINLSRVSQLHKNALARLRIGLEEVGITSIAAF